MLRRGFISACALFVSGLVPGLSKGSVPSKPSAPSEDYVADLAPGSGKTNADLMTNPLIGRPCLYFHSPHLCMVDRNVQSVRHVMRFHVRREEGRYAIGITYLEEGGPHHGRPISTQMGSWRKIKPGHFGT